MKIVVGLGNYGDKYAHTFHNMGFLAVERIAEKLNLKFSKKECDSLVAEGYRNGEKIILAKPLTYMNLSGVAVKQLLGKYKASPTDLVVLFDDLDIERASVRVRLKGSAGTHNGMRNIVEKIGSTDFARVRIGIGPKPTLIPLVDFVLMDIPKNERPAFSEAFDKASDEVITWLDGGELTNKSL